jgi:membrane protein DedA with SNARE-associated domain
MGVHCAGFPTASACRWTRKSTARLDIEGAMEELLLRYGHSLLCVGVMIEAEAFPIGGASLARHGGLSLGVVILAAVLANTAADQAYYLLARAA